MARLSRSFRSIRRSGEHNNDDGLQPGHLGQYRRYYRRRQHHHRFDCWLDTDPPPAAALSQICASSCGCGSRNCAKNNTSPPGASGLSGWETRLRNARHRLNRRISCTRTGNPESTEVLPTPLQVNDFIWGAVPLAQSGNRDVRMCRPANEMLEKLRLITQKQK